ncbi:MAG: ComF family protein [Methylocystis sp.]|nr:ComF family protein [Methylocystis sp.]MCA3582739.1 ComF family protein [Methylocystis sp.]MCA3587055.1 ComF family protein [Methylocystis sp.]MCA3592036.1 ComF family protein [Methylocystis sp.]
MSLPPPPSAEPFATAGPGWRQLLRGGLKAVLDTAYPPQCAACREITAEPATLCARCWREMPFIARPYCERLGTPFAVDIGGPLLSPAAIADPPVFNRARSVARHDGAARELVHKLKYGDRQELALAMGAMMATAAADCLAEAAVIVPVPLHWTRLWQRRFNQAAALAAVIGAKTGLPVEARLLRRRKRTESQVGKSRAERQANLQGAFIVPEEMKMALKGRHVLLIDDVMTTNSTANAASRVLLRGGAAGVDIVTFARVVMPA